MMNTRLLTPLALATALLCASIGPASAAPSPSEFLQKIPAPLPKLNPEMFTAIAANRNAYQATIKLAWPGLAETSVTAFIYEGADGAQVLAVTGLPAMTAKNLLGGWAPEIGLSTPILFWTKTEGMLETGQMPRDLRAVATLLGMPDAVQAAQGFNLFGKVNSGFIKDLSTPLNLPNLNDFIAGVSMKGKNEYAASLSLAAGKTWNKPFKLEKTAMSGGTLRITGQDKDKTVEAWGTAKLDGPKPGAFKEVTFYAKQDGDEQTLGFDTDSASLENFFQILGIAADTLGIPKIPAPPGLPLRFLELQRTSVPSCRPYTSRSAPPDPNCMMFYGARQGTKLGELITHAQGRVFSQPVAKVDLSASASGVSGAAALDLAVGPLKAASASFYLDVGKSASPPPKMGVTLNSAIFGDIDLKAGVDPKAQSGHLTLDVPAHCPTRPLGLRANLTDLTVKDFPIALVIDDCLGKALVDVANGAVEIGGDVANAGKEAALGAAENAAALGSEAGQAVASLHVERVAAWGPALVTHGADLEAAKDAVGAAQKTIGEVTGTIENLGGDIKRLGDAIGKLAGRIEDLLSEAWHFITGEIKSLRREKSGKESERDRKRTELAAAEQRKTQAEAVLAKASTALKELPGPNLTGPVAELNQKILGAQAQSEVQPQIAAFAATLANDLVASPARRKEVLAGVKPEQFVADYKAALSANYTKIGAFTEVKGGKPVIDSIVDDAKRALLIQAVSKRIEDETERRLIETVPTLPTMAFDVPVSIDNMRGSCIIVKPSRYSLLVNCSDNRNRFKFGAGGKLATGIGCMTKSKNPGEGPVLGDSCDTSTLFFYDPIDSLIRYLPEPTVSAPLCLRTSSNQGHAVLTTAPCPAPGQSLDGWQWKLVPESGANMPTARPLPGAKPGAPLLRKISLDPLSLRPLPTGRR